MIKRYKKLPVVVEALQLRWDTWCDMCDFIDVGALSSGKPCGEMLSGLRVGLSIPTLEGVMTAEQGDYIIKGIRGEIYPVKEDIFKQTYEEVD